MDNETSKYTREVLEPLVTQSSSMASLIRLLGLKRSGGAYAHLKNRIADLGIDTSHWKGKGWAKGTVLTTQSSVLKVLSLRDNSGKRTNHGTQLRKALLAIGRAYICESCKMEPQWNGQPLCLQVDHKNGQWYDNRPENLQFLCPNCHSQTKTWGNPNRK